jgi:adenine-specific DNA-methyltransferase
MSQNHRRDPPAINPTKNSSLFEVPYNLGRYERQWWQREALKGADDEHRAVVLKFFKAEPLAKAPSPLLHARKANAFVHVDGIDSIFTRSEVMEVAEATAAAGGKEIYVLAWDFEMDIRQVAAAVEAQTGVKLRLARIPREIMEKNRTEVPPFFEVAMLEAAPVLRKEGKATKVDIKLANFLPSLSEVPSKELEALQERAVASGFDFIDFWAVDFDWAPTRAFNHHWQDFRTRQDRVLKTVSDAGHVYPRSAAYTACVKVVDVFGCDTSITVQVQV